MAVAAATAGVSGLSAELDPTGAGNRHRTTDEIDQIGAGKLENTRNRGCQVQHQRPLVIGCKRQDEASNFTAYQTLFVSCQPNPAAG